MDQTEELEQIATWFREEGLAPDSSKEAQLGLLWRALQHTRCRLSSVTTDLENHRSQHSAEMAEVRKSLEQIRIFTEHKDVLAQEIQDENDQLQEQLRRLVSLQDAQISEVAKMLYQQGLTELIHSSPSEQVAYLLVERASLLETSVDPDNLPADGNTASLLGAEAQTMNTSTRQAEARHSACQPGSLERECSRLERDLEEGSRRLAMAHSEIRRLTDELESAHLTQRAYEPELQSAQQEVEQLRQEVENLKKYEMVELRKAKDLNDRLDLEIRALRNRVRCLDAEKNSLQQSGGSLQEKVEQLEAALKEQQQHLLSVQLQAKAQAAELVCSQQTSRNLQENLHAQTRRLLEKEDIVKSLQREVERQQLDTVQAQANTAEERAQSRATELTQTNQACRDLQNKLSAHMKSLLEKESEIQSLRQQLEDFQDKNIHKICSEENDLQDETPKADVQLCEATQSQLEEDKELKTHTERPDDQEEMTTTQDECEALKMEICETLKCLDRERSKYHEMKEKHKAKLCRAKQKFEGETTWRDEKIRTLERELSLSSHSLAKERELVLSISVENEKLLFEKRKLLQQLNEADVNKKDSNLTASLSKFRVDFLEMENKKLGNKIFHMSNQLAALQRRLQSVQPLHFAQELNKMANQQQISTSRPQQPSSVGFLDCGATKQTDVTSSHHCYTSGSLSRSAEMGYLNLTSTQSPANR